MDFEKLEGFIFEKMRETKLPGLSIAVSRDRELAWSGTFGFKDVAKGKAVDLKTFFGIGSITKSFTCLAIMKLREDGKLSLRDPVSEYVPLDVEGVEIHHLMSHTSGIPALGYAEATIRQAVGVSENWYPIAKDSDVLRFMKGLKDWHLWEPGQRWFYLNEGYEILGMIVERVSGKSFKEYLIDEIVKPMGLNCVFLDEFDKVDMAKPYVVKNGKIEESVIPLGAIGADGGLACSVIDLVEYADFYLSNGRGVISEDSISEMEEIRVDLPYEGPYGREGYGYGLMVLEDFLGRRIIGHGGSILVYTAHFLYSREDGIGVAVLSNGSGYSMANFARYALAYFIGENPDDLPFVKMDKTYEELSGIYKTFKGTVEIRVSRVGDLLKIEYPGSLSEPSILIPDEIEGEVKRFYELTYNSRYPVEFFKENGKILMIHERFVYEKVE